MTTPAAEEVEEAVVAKPKRATRAKSTTPRAPRARKTAEPPRMKIVWAIYNQHLRRVATFNFDQSVEAEKKLKELTKDGGVYFKQKVKEEVGATPEVEA
jgi:hypothetical protein